MVEIARLTAVRLREVWPHEAADFSRWLADNLDYLSEATGLALSLVQREAGVGDFAVDLLLEDNAGNQVVVECQLEKTDHDHLGKLITYMSNVDAKVAIWITSGPRPEHERAIQWLNECLPVDTALFLVTVEAYRIANSPPAVKFTAVAGPSEESRLVGLQRKQLAERHLLRLEFWKQLLERAASKTHPHAKVSPSKGYFLSAGAGKTGFSYSYVVLMDGARVGLVIDTGDDALNGHYFKQLYEKKDEIEAAFGDSLEWREKEGKRAREISYIIRDKGGLQDREKWAELQEAMIDAMVRLEKALSPHIQRVRPLPTEPSPPAGPLDSGVGPL